MSFVRNEFQQISLADTVNQLTDRERRRLEGTWAKPFAEIVFPAIDESPYEVLYSSKDSRPNTPVNIIIGALILKELNGLTDEGIMDALLFDIRYRYALHTTSFQEQPISDRTLSRFRARCLAWQEQTGEDLLHKTMCGLASVIAQVIDADAALLRMDSLMIESNIRKLGRLELIYETERKALKAASAAGTAIPDDLMHYLRQDDRSRRFYHGDEPKETVLADAERILALCPDSSAEKQLVERVLREQTEVNDSGTRVLRSAGSPELNSHCLQSPHDPDAAFRHKAKSDHHGYAANVVEAVGPYTSTVLDYQYEQNTFSDSRFLKEFLEDTGPQEQKTVLVADGGYSGSCSRTLTAENNICLITTNMTGKPTEEYLNFRKTGKFKKYSAFRNGVETIPSILRRKYHIDRMPVRGKLRTAFWFGCKITALNVNKLCIHLRCLNRHAQTEKIG